MKGAPSLVQLIPDIYFDPLAYILLTIAGNRWLAGGQWWGTLISSIFLLLFLHEAHGQQVFFFCDCCIWSRLAE